MKISVVIPVKNRAALLRATLQNLLRQTLVPYEILVVDDQSTDDLETVIASFDGRVKLLANEGRGPGAARNTGLRNATGELIQFFDSDDLMTVDKLESQHRTLIAENADFVYGPYVKAVEKNQSWQACDVIMQYYPLPEMVRLPDLVLEGWCPITQSCLFQRSLINKAGWWREDLMPHEDYEYWFRLSKHTTKYSHESKSCVIYRQHGLQITDKNVVDKDRWLDGLKAMTLIEQQVDYSPRWKSWLLFKGRQALSKKAFNEKFSAAEKHFPLSLTDQYRGLAAKVFQKLGTRVTKSNWQIMHGVLVNGRQVFDEAIEKLKSE